MGLDSLIRLKQLNRSELSGYILDVVGDISITGSTGSLNTGDLTGIFYPLNSNPNSYITSSQTGDFIDLEYLNSSNSGLLLSLNNSFYPLKSNPNGYLKNTGIESPYGLYFFIPEHSFFDGTSYRSFTIYDERNATYVFDYGTDDHFLLRGNIDGTGVVSIDISNRLLQDTNNNIVLDWRNKILSGIWRGQSISISGFPIVNSSQTGIFINTGMTGNFINSSNTGSLTGVFYPLNSNPSEYLQLNSSNNNTISPSGRYLLDSHSHQTIDWANRLLYGGYDLFGGEHISVDWANAQLKSQESSATPVSLDWTNGILYRTTDSGVSLNWKSRTLSGTWNAQNITLSGYRVLTSNDTGIFILSNILISTGNYLQNEINNINSYTGNYTGLFYPLKNNVSGYIPYEAVFTIYSGLNTSAIRPKANKGWLLDTNDIPSVDWVSRNLIDSGNGIVLNWQNKQITGNWEIENLLSHNNIYVNNSKVIVSSDTGIFTTNTNLFNTGNLLATWTGNSTNIYYPKASNPSGYITNSQIGRGVVRVEHSNSSTEWFYPATDSDVSRGDNLSAAFSGASSGDFVLIGPGNYLLRLTENLIKDSVTYKFENSYVYVDSLSASSISGGYHSDWIFYSQNSPNQQWWKFLGPVTIDGAGITNKIGLCSQGGQGRILKDVTFKNLYKGAWLLSSAHESNTAENLYSINCNYGFYLNGEFWRFFCCTARSGDMGFYITEGNNHFLGCTSIENKTGLYLDNGNNPGHAPWIGGEIVHNTMQQIYISDAFRQGWYFDGVTIAGGAPMRLGGGGCQFVGGHIYSPLVSATPSGIISFDSVVFFQGLDSTYPSGSITGLVPNVYLSNCRTLNGWISDTTKPYNPNPSGYVYNSYLQTISGGYLDINNILNIEKSNYTFSDLTGMSFSKGGALITPYGSFGESKNLLKYSNDFNTSPWQSYGAGSFDATKYEINTLDTLAPDNTYTAFKLMFTGYAGDKGRSQNITFNSGNIITNSIWVKTTGNSKQIIIGHDDINSNGYSVYNIQPNFWNRIRYTTTGLTSTSRGFFFAFGNGVNTGSCYFWGAQSEYGSGTSIYTKTTDTQFSGTGLFINNIYSGTTNLGNYFINTGQTGSFLNISSTGQFAANSNLVSTGSYLYSLINASTAGVSSINVKSGALNLTGSGNITISSNGQNIIVSGNTGQLINAFYPLNENVSGYIPYQTIFGSYSGLATSAILPKNNAGWILDTGNITSIWWVGRSLIDNTSNLSIDWGNRRLTDSSSSAVFDWGSKQITGTWSAQNINIYGSLKVNDIDVINNSQTGNFVDRSTLINTGNILSSWTGLSTGLFYPLKSNPSGYVLTGNNNSNTIYPSQRLLVGSDGYSVMDWGQRKLYADAIISNGATIDWNNTVLNGYAVGEPYTLNWTSGRLYNINDGTVALDWKNKILSGSWTGQSISISGFPIVNSSQTGQFASVSNLNLTGTNISNWTGSSTGLFYPLKGNPSGYILPYVFNLSLSTGLNTTIDIGNFNITNGAHDIGINISVSTPSYSVVKYYHLTTQYIAPNSTWYEAVPLTTSGPYAGNDFTLDFNISGNYQSLRLRRASGTQPATANVQLINYGFSSDVFTQTTNTGLVTPPTTKISFDGFSNIYYPLTYNPSGYITTGQTGQFAISSNLISTGSYLLGLINTSSAGVSSLNSASGSLNLLGTGNVTIATNGQNITISGNTGYYPLSSNPSGYITTGQTGVFITTGMTGNFGVATNTGSLTGIFYPLNSNPSGYLTSATNNNKIISYFPNTTTFNISTSSPFIAYYGTGHVTGILPLISTCSGQMFYFINLNRGAVTPSILSLTGSGSDLINISDVGSGGLSSLYYDCATNGGEIIINDGKYWHKF